MQYIFISPSIININGYTPSEYMNRTVQDQMPEEEFNKIRAFIKEGVKKPQEIKYIIS